MLNTNTFLSLTHITCVATKSTLWSLDGAALNVINSLYTCYYEAVCWHDTYFTLDYHTNLSNSRPVQL